MIQELDDILQLAIFIGLIALDVPIGANDSQLTQVRRLRRVEYILLYPVVGLRTRPLLKDGLTRYKLSFGARLCKDNSKHTCVRLMILHDSPGVRSFLTNNPFLFKNQKKNLCRALFVETNGGITAKALNDAVKSSSCEGTQETLIYTFGDINLPEVLDAASQKISVHRAEELIHQA